jgi:hypothetical protein
MSSQAMQKRHSLKLIERLSFIAKRFIDKGAGILTGALG